MPVFDSTMDVVKVGQFTLAELCVPSETVVSEVGLIMSVTYVDRAASVMLYRCRMIYTMSAWQFGRISLMLCTQIEVEWLKQNIVNQGFACSDHICCQFQASRSELTTRDVKWKIIVKRISSHNTQTVELPHCVKLSWQATLYVVFFNRQRRRSVLCLIATNVFVHLDEPLPSFSISYTATEVSINFFPGRARFVVSMQTTTAPCTTAVLFKNYMVHYWVCRFSSTDILTLLWHCWLVQMPTDMSMSPVTWPSHVPCMPTDMQSLIHRKTLFFGVLNLIYRCELNLRCGRRAWLWPMQGNRFGYVLQLICAVNILDITLHKISYFDDSHLRFISFWACRRKSTRESDGPYNVRFKCGVCDGVSLISSPLPISQ